jgi:hypothetical protein
MSSYMYPIDTSVMNSESMVQSGVIPSCVTAEGLCVNDQRCYSRAIAIT